MTSQQTNWQISHDQKSIVISLDGDQAQFHAVWLRDNAEVASQPGQQKKSTVLTYPDSVTLGSADIDDGALALTFQPENLQYRFPLAWLKANRYDDIPVTNATTRLPKKTVCWNHRLDLETVTASYPDIQRERSALLHWLSAVDTHGFGILKNMAGTPDELLDVTALFGYPRETNYGKVFNVKSEVNPANLAYSSLALQAHTDNPYRDPVPTLQILSCIENTTDGGLSVVVDGFNAAVTLQQENPDHFELLSQYNVGFQYTGHGDIHLTTKKPMLELDVEGVIKAIRFNNRSVAPLKEIPYDKMEEYYAAYRHLAEIIERESMSVSFQLTAGELFMVNNQRVLHGRTGYDSAGTRWLQGCYPDIDGLHSTIDVLRNELNHNT